MCALYEGKIVGSIFLSVWGKWAFFGPLNVLPEYQGMKIAQILLDWAHKYFEENNLTHTGL